MEAPSATRLNRDPHVERFLPSLLLLLLPCQFALGQVESSLGKTAIDDNSKYTNVGNIAITVTNFGVIGHGFRLWPIQPSFQYPRGSGIEHLFVGGLWVGANTPNGIRVTTAAVDVGSLRSGAMRGFEFTTGVDSRVIERSSLPDNKYFHPDAISHQDFLADFSDTNTTNPNQRNEPILDHTPMGIAVHLETYAFNYSFADNFVIFNYWIKNVSSGDLDSVYVSMYGDLVVRNTNITPPTAGTPFFNKGGVGYIDSLRLGYAYDYNGDGGEADTYGAFKFLGSTPHKATTSYQTWQFSNTTEPTYFYPQTDPDKYTKMATGLLPVQIQAVPKPSNFMTLITTGPFTRIAAGDSINVVFALLAAKMLSWNAPPPDPDQPANRKLLYQACEWAQRTYNGEDRNGNGIEDSTEVWTGRDAQGQRIPKRYFLPSPPSSPRVKVVLSDKQADLYWDASSEESIDPISNRKDFEGYRIYGTNPGIDLTESQDFLSNLVLLGDFDRSDDRIGYNTGFGHVRLSQPVLFPGDPTSYVYKFTVPYLLSGWQYAFAVTAYDSGDAVTGLESLESSRLQTMQRVVVGVKPVVGGTASVGVYPNPYYTRAYWDGTQERDRKLYFFNLPAHAEIRIYTLAGDLVDVIQHDAATYNGGDIRWFQKYGDPAEQMSGGEHAWDLITKNDQAIASGLYLFVVKDADSGNLQRGKFLVIK
jgi:hypothetical protein